MERKSDLSEEMIEEAGKVVGRTKDARELRRGLVVVLYGVLGCLCPPWD